MSMYRSKNKGACHIHIYPYNSTKFISLLLNKIKETLRYMEQGRTFAVCKIVVVVRVNVCVRACVSESV